MAMQISGTIKVWKNVHEVRKGVKKTYFNTSIGNKQEDGSYINSNLNVRFKKDSKAFELIENGTDIDIKNAWLSVYEKNDTDKVIYLFVSDFEIVKEAK